MPLRPVPQVAIDFLKKVEGLRLTSYQDDGGVWTNGYGHTKGVPANVTISQSIADANLIGDADEAANRISDMVNEPVILALSDDQWAALISFAFNLGVGPESPRWQIWNDLNTGDLGDITKQMLRFDHGLIDGKEVEVPGLKNRRMAEIALWNSADHATAAALATPEIAPSSGYTRAIATPPQPQPIPMHGVSLVTKLATGIGAIGAGASQVHDIILPHVNEAPMFQQAAAVLTGVVIVSSVVALYIHNQQTQAAKV